MKKRMFMVLIALFAFIPLIGVKAEDAIELNMDAFIAAYTAGEGVKTGHITYHIEGGNPIFELESGDYVLTENIMSADVYFSGGESTLNIAEHKVESIETRNGATLNITKTGLSGWTIPKVTAKTGTVINIEGGHFKYINANGGKITLDKATISADGTYPYALLVENSGEVEIKETMIDGSIGVINGKLLVESAEVAAGTHEDTSLYGIVVEDLGEVEILDGRFGGPDAAILARSQNGDNVKSIVIRGGQFESAKVGLDIAYNEVDSLKIYKGTFMGADETSIKLRGGTTDNFNDMLADGSVFIDGMGNDIIPLSGTGFVYIEQKIARVIQTHKIIADLNGGTPVDSSMPLEELIPSLVSVDNPLVITLEDLGNVKPPAGKVFSHFEIDGEKYSIGAEYTIDNTKDVTIKWIWKDISSSNKGENNPATGDNIFLYIILAVLSLAGLTGACFYIKKRVLK